MPSLSNQRKSSPPTAAAKSVVAPRLPRRRSAWKFGLLLFLLAVPATAAALYWTWWPKHVCRRCEAALATCAPERIDEHVRALDVCGPDGRRALVQLIQSPRAEVAQAACAALRVRLQLLVSGDAPVDDAAASELADLLELLAARTPDGVPDVAQELIWDVLESTGRLRIDARLPLTTHGRLVVACQTLLERPIIETTARPESPPAAPPSSSIATRATASDIAATAVAAASAQPSLPSPEPANAPATAMQPSDAAVVVETPASALANAAARVNPIRGPMADNRVEQVSTATSRPVLNMASPAATESSTSSVPANLALEKQTAWSLFADLGSTRGSAAAAELRRRGFTDRELELGRHLTSPDSAERLHYARLLPSLVGSSLKPWLLHLSTDADAEVRQACVAIMAGTSDAAVAARLREMAFTDGDEEVRRQAIRIVDRAGGRR